MSKLTKAQFWVLRNAFYVVVLLYTLSLVVLLLLQRYGQVAPKDLLSPFATVTGLLGAALGLLHQQRVGSSRRYDYLAKRSYSARFVEIRSKVARSLLENRRKDPVCWLLCEFFDEIAYKTRVGIVDIDIIYHAWSNWILPYWVGLKKHVDRALQKHDYDRDVYVELEWLAQAFCLRNPVGKGALALGPVASPQRASHRKGVSKLPVGIVRFPSIRKGQRATPLIERHDLERHDVRT